MDSLCVHIIRLDSEKKLQQTNNEKHFDDDNNSVFINKKKILCAIFEIYIQNQF